MYDNHVLALQPLGVQLPIQAVEPDKGFTNQQQSGADTVQSVHHAKLVLLVMHKWCLVRRVQPLQVLRQQDPRAYIGAVHFPTRRFVDDE